MDFHSDEINLRAVRRKFPLFILCFKVNFESISSIRWNGGSGYFPFVTSAEKEREGLDAKVHCSPLFIVIHSWSWFIATVFTYLHGCIVRLLHYYIATCHRKRKRTSLINSICRRGSATFCSFSHFGVHIISQKCDKYCAILFNLKSILVQQIWIYSGSIQFKFMPQKAWDQQKQIWWHLSGFKDSEEQRRNILCLQALNSIKIFQTVSF